MDVNINMNMNMNNNSSKPSSVGMNHYFIDLVRTSLKKKSIRISFLIGVVTLVSIIYWDSSHKANISVQESNEKKHIVVVQQVENQELVIDFQSVILIQPWTEVTLKPAPQSTVKQIYVHVGDVVRLNQGLVRLESESQQIKGELDKIDRRMKDIDFAVTMNLAKKDFLSKNEVKTKELEYQANQLKSRLSDLENSGVIKSPIQGIVAEISLKNGDFIDGNGNYYIKVIDSSKLKSTLYVPKDIVQYLKVGQSVRLTQTTVGNSELLDIDGSITAIAPIVDTKTGSVLIELSIPQQSVGLIPGSYLDLTVDLTKKESLALAEKALIFEDNKSYVYKIEKVSTVDDEDVLKKSNDRNLASASVPEDRFIAKKILVQAGVRTNGLVEIKSGLEEFDQVVLQGLSGLSDGQEIEIVEP